MKARIDTWGTGHGEPRTVLEYKLATLARGGARRAALKIETSKGDASPCEASDVEEFEAIYRAELVRAIAGGADLPPVARRGFAPALWAKEEGGAYRFPQYEAVRAAMREAGRLSRSAVYRSGWEEYSAVRADVAEVERRAGIYGKRADYSGGTRLDFAAGADSGEPSKRRKLALVREYQANRLRLALYWWNKGGDQWSASLERGLRLLGAVHHWQTGQGVGGLLVLEYAIDSEADATTRERQTDKLNTAVRRLMASVAQGEADARKNPQAASNSFTFLEAVAEGGKPGFKRAVLCKSAMRAMRRHLLALEYGEPQAVARRVSADSVQDRVFRNRRHAVGIMRGDKRAAWVRPNLAECGTVTKATRRGKSRHCDAGGRSLGTVFQVDTLPSATAAEVRANRAAVNGYGSALVWMAASGCKRAAACVGCRAMMRAA